MPVGIEQEIFRLEIPVDYVEGVDVLDTKQDLTRIELASALGKAAGAAEVDEEFAASAILEHHVQLITVFAPVEDVKQFYDPWVV